MRLSRSEKMLKKRREVLSAYTMVDTDSWRRVYPESFYASDGFVNPRQLEYIGLIYDIFLATIDGSKEMIIEDEINLIYMEIESKLNSEKFSENVISAIQDRLDLKKKYLQEIKELAEKAELKLSDLKHDPPHIRFRLESTTYLVRLLAYGLYTDSSIVFDRVAEVFNTKKLRFATETKDKKSMDNALKFLYRGLIQKNESGRQGSRRAAKQALNKLSEWYHDNEYVMSCIEKIGKYVE